jgi:hypothetical protein
MSSLTQAIGLTPKRMDMAQSPIRWVLRAVS